MTRSARSSARASASADAASDTVMDWLRAQPVRAPSRAVALASKEGQPEEDRDGEPTALPVPGATASAHPEPPFGTTPRRSAVWQNVRLSNPDWLHHRLTISGPAEELARFRDAASGAGIIPWHYDLARMEADLFHLLVAPEPRELSLAGARIFARQLSQAVGRRHDVAVSLVGRSRACPFDLHALVPVPADILALGPDEPEALGWLWQHWGTTQELRHVAVEPAPDAPAAGRADVSEIMRFWSADWTPWRALDRVRSCWPRLRFAVRPSYDL